MKGKNLLKHNSVKFGFLVLRSLIISAILIATFSRIPIPQTKGWMDMGWTLRKPITITNDGSELTNEDILVEVDTASLITDEKLQEDCGDIRFTDSDGNTDLEYWIESGCNTSSTQIWVEVPSIPNGGKNIFMYYNNPAAESESLTWSGNLFMYADTSCPDGWTRASDLDGKFLYGSDTYGNTGGADSHSHGNVSTTSTSISTTGVAGSSSSGTSGTTTSHTHTGLQASVSSNGSLPPYLETIICYKNDFSIPSGLISMFNTSTPSGWTRYSSLDNLFVRSNSSYGGTGGSNTHSHTATGSITTDSSSNTQNTINPPFSATGGTITTSGGYTIHTFNSSGTFTPNVAGSVDVLVVGGGGGGRMAWLSGGGGGGQVIYQANLSITSDAKTITVGDGGIGGAFSYNGNNGTNGGSSSFGTQVIASGGYGGQSGYGATSGAGYTGGIPYDGGANSWGGNGGGAGGNGPNGNPNNIGGAGIANSISGVELTYGGGGGGSGTNHTYRQFGRDGGGDGGTPSAGATAGVTNRGGGGGGSYAGTGGNGGSGVVIIRYPTPGALSGSISTSSHTHTSSATTTSTNSNLPPYLDMVFAKTNSDTYITSDNVIPMTSLPPLGWSRFTELDSKFPRAAETYGGTGGSATHTHTVDISTGAPSATINAYGTGVNFSDSTHTHSGTATTDTQSNLPSYTTVIYSQRNISLTAILGTEEAQNSAPYAPSSLQVEEQSGSAMVSDTTPEFTAIFSDIDGSNTGNYYQIQVNTSSDFTGTTMWDSTKTAFVPAISNGERSSEITYAGSELVFGDTYYWRIKFWDNETYSNESDWSATAQFTMDSIPTVSADNITNTSDIYAGLPISVQAVYSDADGSSDLDRLYIKIHNPSAETDIEYYLTTTGSNQNGQYPTSVSGSEYISAITYDITYDSPTSNDITVTWDITVNWGWIQGSSLTYGIKATDHGGATSEYANTSSTYLYENRLTFHGDISVKDTQNNTILEDSWYPSNLPIIVSGLKVVYYGTTNVYPLDSHFDVKITNEEESEWFDTTSSGENISISCSTPNISNPSDTYELSIVSIPTGGVDLSAISFTVKTDEESPTLQTPTSTSHPDDTEWYSSHSGNISWSAEDNQSGIYKVWRLIDQTQSQSVENIIANGLEIQEDGTYNFTINEDGTWYIHIVAKDNVGLSSMKTYKLNIDSQDPTFTSLTSSTHPQEGSWYNQKLATVSWQTEDTGSGVSKVFAYWSTQSSITEDWIADNGTEKGANDSFSISDIENGTWYLHLLAQDNTEKQTYNRYMIKVDSSIPDIVAIAGANNNVLQNTDSGPLISWTDPNSTSDDVFYITKNGTDPTSENYLYTTTSNSYDLPAQGEGTTTIKVRAKNGAGTYSSVKSFIVRYDSTPPSNVSSLSATTTENSIALSWNNPTVSDLARIVVIRNSIRIPTGPSDGTKVYEGLSSTYTDRNLNTNTSYYYAIYTYDTTGNRSSGNVALFSTSSTQAEPIVVETGGEKNLRVEQLETTKQPIITVNRLPAQTTTSGQLHVYSSQNISISIPAQTILDEVKDFSQVVLIVENNIFVMEYDEESDTYKTDITSPSVKGIYDAKIQVLSEDNENQLSLSMSVLVDPYGYVYSYLSNNELRISEAKVSLYTKSNGEVVLWEPVGEDPNPQYTDTQGEYQFFVQPGEYKLVIEANGYIPTETEWFTVETNIVEKNIEMKKNHTILYTILAFAEISIAISIFLFIKKRKHN